MFYQKGTLRSFTPSQIFSCEFCKIFKNHFLSEHLRKATFSTCIKDSEIAQILFTHIRVDKTVKGCKNGISNKIIYICISSNSHFFNVNYFIDLQTLLKSLCELCYKKSFQLVMVCVLFIFEYMKSGIKDRWKASHGKIKDSFFVLS